MKSILVIVLANPTNNPRPNRMIRCLENHYKLTVVGLGSFTQDNIEFIALNPTKENLLEKIIRGIKLKLGQYEKVLWNNEIKRVYNLLIPKQFDLIICHDLMLLPLAQKIKGNAKILFDAREYYPKHFEDQFIWRFFLQGINEYLCAKYLKNPDHIVTVSSGIAKEYKKEYNVEVEVLPSWSFYHNLAPSKVNPEKIQIIHHGHANPSRRIEQMIKMMDYVDERFHLDLMLTYEHHLNYLKFLQKEASYRANVNIIEPVAYEDIIPFTNQYDIGIFLVPPSTFNLLHTLPNKFFEFIQARLAIAIGPSPDMQAIVKQYNLGIVAKDFNEKNLAKELNKLSMEQIAYNKEQSNKAAKELNAEHNCRHIDQIFRKKL
jgi:hypothetical protein